MEWVKQGVRVTIITCTPNFPQGKVYPGYKNRLWQVEYMEGIRVIRVWTYIAANRGVIRRTLDHISFGIIAFIASLFVRADVIVATSPQFFTAVGGWLASRFKRKPWVMEVRDLWPASIKAIRVVQYPWMIRVLERIEMYLYRSASRVVVVTDSFREDLVSRNIDPDKIEVIKNGVMLDQFVPRRKDEDLVRLFGLENKFVVGYIGTHGLAHGLDFILDCATEVAEDIHFLFIGDGAEKERLCKLKDKLGLTNVTILPPVAKPAVMRYISITDIALVPLRLSDTFKTVLPSKIFENAAMGKPILLGVEGEAKQLVDKYGAGRCYTPENKKDFLAGLEELRNTEKYNESVIGSLCLAADFGRHNKADRMFRVMLEIVEDGNPQRAAGSVLLENTR